MSDWVAKYCCAVDRENDVFEDWWEVTNGIDTFKTDEREPAQWLCDLLNAGQHKVSVKICGFGGGKDG